MIGKQSSGDKPAGRYIVRTVDGAGKIINETSPCNYQGAIELLDLKQRSNPAMRYELLNVDGSAVSVGARAVEERIEKQRQQRAKVVAFDADAYTKERNRRDDLWKRFCASNSVSGMLPVTVIGNDRQIYGVVYVAAGTWPVEAVEFEVLPAAQSVTQYLRAFRERDQGDLQIQLTAQRKRWPVAWDETPNANALTLKMGKASLWSALRHLGFIRSDAFPISSAVDLSMNELRVLQQIKTHHSVGPHPLDEMAFAALLKEGLASRSDKSRNQVSLTARGIEFLKQRDEWE